MDGVSWLAERLWNWDTLSAWALNRYQSARRLPLYRKVVRRQNAWQWRQPDPFTHRFSSYSVNRWTRGASEGVSGLPKPSTRPPLPPPPSPLSTIAPRRGPSHPALWYRSWNLYNALIHSGILIFPTIMLSTELQELVEVNNGFARALFNQRHRIGDGNRFVINR